MKARLQAITLIVEDLQRARTFYEALGFGKRKAGGALVVFDLGENDIALVTRQTLGGLGLSDAAQAPSGQRALLTQHARTREDVDVALREAQAAGARVVRPAADGAWGGYSGAFADPDGNVWLIACNPELYRA